MKTLALVGTMSFQAARPLAASASDMVISR